MSKYIDAEKLKKFVGELKERAKRNRCDSWGIVPDALEEVEGFITSLQQEQPELSNNLVDADAVREDFITEVYRVLDADSTNDRANAIIDAFDSLPTVSQERPEMDLEKEFQEYWCKYQYDQRLRRQVVDGHGKSVLKSVARHFYELGLNARKEK